jgi:chemotaxis protein methyltransferase CheR
MDNRVATQNAVIVDGITHQEYLEFCTFLENSCGIVLGENKQYLVSSRLKKLLREQNLGSISRLVAILKSGSNPTLRDDTIDAMTTNETSWFRDNYPYDALKSVVVPELLVQGKRQIRIWSSACSSGQEPYSISMVLNEFIRERPASTFEFEILATDISPTMLNEARKGTFDSMSIARGLSMERKNKYFTDDNGLWHINENVRSKITFKEANLLGSFSMHGKFDVIFCRNVLIYFAIPIKRDIINRMAQCLNPGGYLFLGGTESAINYTNSFESIRHKNGIIYRLK